MTQLLALSCFDNFHTMQIGRQVYCALKFKLRIDFVVS